MSYSKFKQELLGLINEEDTKKKKLKESEEVVDKEDDAEDEVVEDADPAAITKSYFESDEVEFGDDEEVVAESDEDEVKDDEEEISEEDEDLVVGDDGEVSDEDEVSEDADIEVKDDEEELIENEDEDKSDEEKELEESEEEEAAAEEEKKEIIKQANESVNKVLRNMKVSKQLQEKIATVFIAALTEGIEARVNGIAAKLNKQKAKEFKRFVNESNKNIDRYVTYVAKNWAKDNKVALVEGYKGVVAESVINQVTKVLGNYNIQVPAKDKKLVESLTAERDKYKFIANRETCKNIKLIESLTKKVKEEIITELSEGLSESQTSKLIKLCENIAFDPKKEEAFVTKVKDIKEAFISGKDAKPSNTPKKETLKESAEDSLAKYKPYL